VPMDVLHHKFQISDEEQLCWLCEVGIFIM